MHFQSELKKVVFKHLGKYNLLIVEPDEDLAGRTYVIAHYILPEDWTEDDCYEYAESIIEAMRRRVLPIEHRVVG